GPATAGRPSGATAGPIGRLSPALRNDPDDADPVKKSGCPLGGPNRNAAIQVSLGGSPLFRKSLPPHTRPTRGPERERRTSRVTRRARATGEEDRLARRPLGESGGTSEARGRRPPLFQAGQLPEK